MPSSVYCIPLYVSHTDLAFFFFWSDVCAQHCVLTRLLCQFFKYLQMTYNEAELLVCLT